jgi:hypothetical protein
MKTRYALVVAALASTLTAGTAQAHDWYILDASHARCEAAGLFARTAHVPEFTTPYRLEMFARTAGIFQDVDVSRDADGQPAIVGITVQLGGEPTVMMYFRDLGECKLGAAKLPSPDELN